MLLVAFICLLVVCLATGTLYSIYNYKKTIGNIAVKLSAILSCCVLSLVTANLTSAIGGYSIFVIIGLIFLMLGECITLFDLKENKFFYYFKNSTLAIGFLSIFIAGITYGVFNVFALLFGLFMACGLICLNFAFKRQQSSLSKLISQSILYVVLGLFLGQGLTLTLTGTHLLVGIFYLIAGIFAIISRTINILRKKEDNIARIIGNALYILGLIILSSSIYFI